MVCIFNSKIDKFYAMDENEEEEFVSRQQYEKELFKLYKGRSNKPQWTKERIRFVMEQLEEMPKGRGSSYYYYASCYEIAVTDNGEKYLIVKRKSAADGEPSIKVVPSEVYYDILTEVHKETGHGGRDKMIFAIKSNYLIPTPCVMAFIKLCKICLKYKPFFKQQTLSQNTAVTTSDLCTTAKNVSGLNPHDGLCASSAIVKNSMSEPSHSIKDPLSTINTEETNIFTKDSYDSNELQQSTLDEIKCEPDFITTVDEFEYQNQIYSSAVQNEESENHLRVVNSINNNRGQIAVKDLSSGKFPKWILYYQDMKTEFCFLRPLASVDLKAIAHELLKIFLDIGCPAILQFGHRNKCTTTIINEIQSIWPAVRIINGSSQNPCQEKSTDYTMNNIKRQFNRWMQENDFSNWETAVNFLQFEINNTKNKVTNTTPFEALYGKSSSLGATPFLPNTSSTKVYLEEDLEMLLNKDNHVVQSTDDKSQNNQEFVVHTKIELCEENCNQEPKPSTSSENPKLLPTNTFNINTITNDTCSICNTVLQNDYGIVTFKKDKGVTLICKSCFSDSMSEIKKPRKKHKKNA